MPKDGLGLQSLLSYSYFVQSKNYIILLFDIEYIILPYFPSAFSTLFPCFFYLP